MGVPQTEPVTPLALPADRLERVESWGMNQRGVSYVYRPGSVDAITDVFNLARAHGLTVGLRGAARSYGDAALAREQITLDTTRLSRILEWNPQTGIVRVEPGVTLAQLWRHGVDDGWWPPVVSGTMFPTLAGALAMNIHGKNHVRAGTLGDHVSAFDLLLPSGEVKVCTRAENPDLFHAAIGGFGMLGVFTSITLQMQRIHSGLLRVRPYSVANWDELFAVFDAHALSCGQIVAWVDAFAEGKNAGRGLVQTADYLEPGEDARPTQTLRAENQDLEETVAGVVPKSVLWRFLKPWVGNPDALRFLNNLQYVAGQRKHGTAHDETHAEWAFKLDYLPGWKQAYLPHGLVQYQSFVPRESAQKIFADQIALCQSRGLVPTLAVFKQHRTDNFLMSYAVDGFSLALDFRLTPETESALFALFAEMDESVLNAGGRFYWAKDSALHPASLARYYQEERVQKFLALKREWDPESLLQTDLFRRIFPHYAD